MVKINKEYRDLVVAGKITVRVKKPMKVIRLLEMMDEKGWEMFVKKENETWDEKDQSYAKLLIPKDQFPLDKALREKFQVVFNQIQRANVDHDLQSMGYEIWNICRDANWRVKWHMLNWFKDSRNGHAKVNMGILLLLIFAFFMFGMIFGGLR